MSLLNRIYLSPHRTLNFVKHHMAKLDISEMNITITIRRQSQSLYARVRSNQFAHLIVVSKPDMRELFPPIPHNVTPAQVDTTSVQYRLIDKITNLIDEAYVDNNTAAQPS